MAQPTRIEWAKWTWNPVTGCTPISPGCEHCYARRMAETRLRGRCGYPADDPFRVTVHEDRFVDPMKRRKPTQYFVCSMGDLFHADVPYDVIDRVFAVMALCPQHTFMVLTKRADRMAEYIQNVPRFDNLDEAVERLLADEQLRATGSVESWPVSHVGCRWPLPNVRLGVTAENQEMADQRIPHLLDTPAAYRFVSIEPMLGPVELLIPRGCRMCNHPGNCYSRELCDRCGGTGHEPSLDLVIVGGESGPGARPMHPDWARSVRDQCAEAGVPFVFKHWGEWGPRSILDRGPGGVPNAAFRNGPGHDGEVWRVGKKAAGRLLDGREHNGEVE